MPLKFPDAAASEGLSSATLTEELDALFEQQEPIEFSQDRLFKVFTRLALNLLAIPQ